MYVTPLPPQSTEPLTVEQQDAALAIVAEWLGKAMGYDGPAPTGQDAMYRARGPMLVRDWEPTWTGRPRPTVLLEGGPEEWAITASLTSDVVEALGALGMYAEPYASYALCLYPL